MLQIQIIMPVKVIRIVPVVMVGITVEVIMKMHVQIEGLGGGGIGGGSGGGGAKGDSTDNSGRDQIIVMDMVVEKNKRETIQVIHIVVMDSDIASRGVIAGLSNDVACDDDDVGDICIWSRYRYRYRRYKNRMVDGNGGSKVVTVNNSDDADDRMDSNSNNRQPCIPKSDSRKKGHKNKNKNMNNTHPCFILLHIPAARRRERSDDESESKMKRRKAVIPLIQ